MLGALSMRMQSPVLLNLYQPALHGSHNVDVVVDEVVVVLVDVAVLVDVVDVDVVNINVVMDVVLDVDALTSIYIGSCIYIVYTMAALARLTSTIINTAASAIWFLVSIVLSFFIFGFSIWVSIVY
jgi:hypothetical protein